MATDPATTPQAFAPLVSQFTDALARQLTEAFADLHAQAERARDEAVSTAVSAEAETRARELDAQRAALDAQITALRDDYDARLEAQVSAGRDEREALEERLRVELTTALDAVRQDADLRLAEANARADAARVAAAELHDAAVPGDDADHETPAHARIFEREQALAAGARLLTAFERFDGAHTLRDTLDALVEGLADEVARVLVFVVRGEGLRGWQFVGIEGAPADAASVSVSRSQVGPLAPALLRGGAAEVHPSALADNVPALRWVSNRDGDDATAGIAVPLVVDEQVVALVYCDDGSRHDRDVPAPWPEMVQVLVRHASRCLEAHTARRAAGFSRPTGVVAGRDIVPSAGSGPSASEIEAARRFARLVVSELKLYNEAAVVAGRDARDLSVRLRDELARARRLYEARVPMTLPARDDYFDQEVVRTLADGDPSLLGDATISAA